jgi:hypothetical protein
METCEVCQDTFEVLQRRDEVQGEMTRVVMYKRCIGCGAGRIDFHPYMPKRDFEEE